MINIETRHVEQRIIGQKPVRTPVMSAIMKVDALQTPVVDLRLLVELQLKWTGRVVVTGMEDVIIDAAKNNLVAQAREEMLGDLRRALLGLEGLLYEQDFDGAREKLAWILGELS